MIDRIRTAFQETRVPRPAAPPTMTLHAGPSVPAWVLRVICAAVLAGCGVLVAGSYFSLGVALAGAVAVALWPWAGVPATVAGVLAYLYAIGAADQLIAAALLLALHSVLVLTRLMGSVGPRAQIELAALGQVGVPFAVIQVFAQLLLHLAMGLPALGGPIIWVVLGALAALLVLVILLVRGLRAAT